MRINAICTFICLAWVCGCSRHSIEVSNDGTHTWTEIQIDVGGQSFPLEQLAPKEREKIHFKAQAEDGGTITSKVNSGTYTNAVGYFTPNLSANYEISLRDDGTIQVTETD